MARRRAREQEEPEERQETAGAEPVVEDPALAAEPIPDLAADASPIEPPAARPVAPQAGDSARQPAARVRSTPGYHLRLEDDQGAEVDPDDLFYPQEGPAAAVKVKRRVYQVFCYPGTATPVRQLLLPQEGVMVPIPRAAKIVATMKAAISEGVAPDVV